MYCAPLYIVESDMRTIKAIERDGRDQRLEREGESERNRMQEYQMLCLLSCIYFLSRCLYSFFGLSFALFLCLYRSPSLALCLPPSVCVPLMLYRDPTLSMLHASVFSFAFHNFLSFTRSRKFTHIIQKPHAQQINIA